MVCQSVRGGELGSERVGWGADTAVPVGQDGDGVAPSLASEGLGSWRGDGGLLLSAACHLSKRPLR